METLVLVGRLFCKQGFMATLRLTLLANKGWSQIKIKAGVRSHQAAVLSKQESLFCSIVLTSMVSFSLSAHFRHIVAPNCERYLQQQVQMATHTHAHTHLLANGNEADGI